MYGKHFASMYEGSMVGAGAHVFALWGWIISHAVGGRVEVNPKLLAFVLGDTEEEINRAIEYLTRPDPESRCTEHEGRRMVREGQFQYFLPSWGHYRAIKTPDQLREYNRQKQAEYRARKKQSRQE